MKKWILIFAVALSGCAANPNKIDIPNLTQSEQVAVTDSRPASEKQNDIFSLMITNEAYGIYRRGDEIMNPSGPILLRQRVYEKFGAIGNAKLQINHFVIYWNNQKALRRGVTGAAFGGVIGAAIASGTQKTAADTTASVVDKATFESLSDKSEFKRALYTEQENLNNASVYIVYVSAAFNGKETFIKSVSPAITTDKKDGLVPAVESAIGFYLQQY